MLRAAHLTKRFAAIKALDDVSFELRSGEIHALCGENGAGKSTLINVLSGVHPHGSFQGCFAVDGKKARFRSTRDASNAGIAVIHQELACIDEMTVTENILLGQEPRRWGVCVDRRTALRRVSEEIARLGLAVDPAAPLRTLGIGQKQLVEIAKALARHSRILILDEPTAALAPPEVEALMAILRDLRARGIACIYISHRLAEVLRIADRITVLRDGATVCTLDAKSGDEATLVRHMVGREITDLYARPVSSPDHTVLSVQDLTVTDLGMPRLRNISFDLRAGEVLGIGGLMGAGRSELLMHLFGAWGHRAAGQVVLMGRTSSLRNPRAALEAGIALVTEDRRRFGLLLEQSVGFNLSLSSLRELATFGVIRGRAEARVNRRWFESMGIRGGGLHTAAARLSGGNQQKIVIGKALMTHPKVVMLDEPTRGIDIGAKREIYSLVGRLTASGCAVLLVSSELTELIGVSDRILMLHDGAISGTFARKDATPELLMRAALGPKRRTGPIASRC